MTEGWKCPNCGKAHAPSVLTCPEEPSKVSPTPVTTPYFPTTWPSPCYPSPAYPMPVFPFQPLYTPRPWEPPFIIVTC
jgi:hypothetical protein